MYPWQSRQPAHELPGTALADSKDALDGVAVKVFAFGYAELSEDVLVGERISQVPTHARMITSPGNCRPLNGLLGVIGMEFLRYQTPSPNFATEPYQTASHTSQWNLCALTFRVPLPKV